MMTKCWRGQAIVAGLLAGLLFLTAPAEAQITFRAATQAGAPASSTITFRAAAQAGVPAAATITFRAAAQAGAASGVLTLAINKPAGTVQNDVMIASIAVRPSSATITPPAGWTLVRRMDNTNATDNSLAVYSKVAGAGEPANYSWTFSTSTGSAGGIQTFVGVDTTAPIDVENGQNTPYGTAHATPGVTTTVANAMLVTSHGVSNPDTWTPPTGMAEAVDVLGGNEAVEGNYVVQAAAGATGAKSATSATADVGNAHILALRPTGASLTINKPTGTVQNDVMIASIAVRPQTATITAPAGWTLVRRMDNAGPTANSLAVYRKVAGASEPASYTWTPSAGHTGLAGGIQTFAGVDTTTPIDVENGQTTASSLSHSTPSVTTTVANTMLVTSHGIANPDTWTPPTGMAEAFDVLGGNEAIEGSYVLQAVAGPTGAKQATSTPGPADFGNAHILALRSVGVSLTINKPTGTVQNDVMIASIAVRPQTVTLTAPAGWTLVRRMDNAGPTANSLAVYRKVAGASEPASYTWTPAASHTGLAGGIRTFVGVNTTTPIDVENGQTTPSSLSHSTPSVTTTVANTMLVTSHGIANADTWTPPTGMTEAFDVQGGLLAIEGSYVVQAAAGATGAKQATSTPGPADVGNAHILALRPDFSCPAEAQWCYGTGAASMAPPALDPWSNVVISGSNDNNLHGMSDANGTQAFAPLTTGGPIQARPAVVPAAFRTPASAVNIAYVTSQDGYLYAVNTSTGAQVWKAGVSCPAPCNPLGSTLQGGAGVWLQALAPLTFAGGVTSDVVVVGTRNTGGGSTTDNKVYAVRGDTGAIVWTFAPGNMDIITSEPQLDSTTNSVWVTSRSNSGTQASLWKLDAAAGTLISSWNNAALSESDTSATAGSDSSPIFSWDSTFVYLGTNAGRLKAIRASDGTVFSHTPASGAGAIRGAPWWLSYDYLGAATPDTIIFVRNTTVHSVNFDGSTFSPNWTTTLTWTPSPPVDDSAGNLYFGGSDGKLHRFAVSDGTDLAQVPATAIAGSMGEPTLNWDLGVIHVGGTDGHIYTFAVGF